MLHQSKMDMLTRCYGGGGAPKAAKPPPPPAPTTAAENLAKNKILERQRSAKGYGSTLIGSLASTQDSRQSLLKSLLGQ